MGARECEHLQTMLLEQIASEGFLSATVWADANPLRTLLMHAVTVAAGEDIVFPAAHKFTARTTLKLLEEVGIHLQNNK